MKWKDITLLSCFLIALILIFIIWQKNQKINQLQTINQEKRLDTLKQVVIKSIVEYKERVKTNKEIVDRWHIVSDTIKDTLIIQAKADILYLDTSLKKCDTALNNCITLADSQDKLINLLKRKKEPLISPYAGLGLSMDKNLLVSPSVQIGIGINLSKVFRKK